MSFQEKLIKPLENIYILTNTNMTNKETIASFYWYAFDREFYHEDFVNYLFANGLLSEQYRDKIKKYEDLEKYDISTLNKRFDEYLDTQLGLEWQYFIDELKKNFKWGKYEIPARDGYKTVDINDYEELLDILWEVDLTYSRFVFMKIELLSISIMLILM